jgi:NAD(P)-dependent dehydrogenase (short-subunit alcohol dehydrogenase family)
MPKTVIVVGAASGIGEATARLFAARGWNVVLVDRNGEALTQVETSLSSDAARIRSYTLDISSDPEIAEFASAIRPLGPVDAYVNSAGLLENAIRTRDLAMSEYDAIMNVNLRGTFLLSRTIGAMLCDQGHGSMVHLCSMTSVRPSAQPAYAISKAGLKMLTEVMAAEFGPRGVRVNAVAPGYTLTPALKARIERGERDPSKVFDKSALKRFVLPEDVAEAIWFLSSDAANAITGVMLPVDCGWIPYSSYISYAAQPE